MLSLMAGLLEVGSVSAKTALDKDPGKTGCSPAPPWAAGDCEVVCLLLPPMVHSCARPATETFTTWRGNTVQNPSIILFLSITTNKSHYQYK